MRAGAHVAPAALLGTAAVGFPSFYTSCDRMRLPYRRSGAQVGVVATTAQSVASAELLHHPQNICSGWKAWSLRRLLPRFQEL